MRQLVIKVLNIIDARCNHEVPVQFQDQAVKSILGGKNCIINCKNRGKDVNIITL